MKNSSLNDSDKYKKSLKHLRIIFVVFLGVFIFTIYNCFDYFLFKYIISRNYIFTNSLDAIYDQALGEDNYTNYNKNFDEVVFSIFTEKIRDIGNDRYTYLYSPTQYKKINEDTKNVAALATIDIISDDTVYILIPNISKYTKDFLYSNVELLNKYKNIIIDLQDNHGGDLEKVYKMENLFLDKGTTLGFETTRISILTKEVKAKKRKKFEFENIIILQNDSTASAAESFIMALKENLSNVTLIGTTTFGKGIGQITLPLISGYAIKATVLTVETPNYNSIHKKGIEPDIVYEGDDIINFALAQLSPVESLVVQGQK